MSNIVFFDDGHVGMSVERHDATLRFFASVETGGKPRYIASALARRWTDKVATISGAHGDMSIRHQALTVSVLYEAGFRWLFTDRASGLVPLSTLCTHPAFEGWFECDLSAAMERINKRRERIQMQSEDAP